MTAPATPASPAASGHYFGNRITSARGWYGQFTVACQRTGRTVYVCGQPEQHIRQGFWRRDRRMDGNGQGWLCTVCWTLEAGVHGIFER